MPLCAILLVILLNEARFLPAAADCATGLSVVAPELAVPGKITAVLVTLHGSAGNQPLNISLKLLPDGANEESQHLLETIQEIKGHGILPLQIPQDAAGNYLLQTTVNCTGSCTLQSSSQIRLVGPVRDVIIRPAKQAYQPGETISFWVLALDHDLQIAKNTIGSVSVKNPEGTKVVVWDQVALDEGVKAFTLPLSTYANAGKWLLHVEVESNEFYTAIEVAPGLGAGYPDVAAAEEHYVELRFGKEMRRRYKPGLPFTGKVEAMSTEKSVRVRVKVYDNTTSIYSQDIEIAAGEGTFTVPAILADSDVITLQAELVSVESKEIESHYVLAREPIHKWNSTSECYLLIEGVEHTLQPDEQAYVTILSTCPCEKDIHYVITTDGRVTDWAQRRYEDPVPPSVSNDGNGAYCKLNFSFAVKSVMAPVSQLLVYYITPEGEPISDVISFDVKLLHKQIYVNMEDREYWLPNQPLDLEVVAEQNAMVCLLGGRSMSNNDIRFDPRISVQHETNPIAGEIDFLEAGVSFFQRRCVRKADSEVSAVSYKQRGSGAGPANRRRPPESLIGGVPFDQLWLWKCFNYTSEIASSGITTSAPQEAGKWSLWALTVSSSGLRFSAPVTVHVFRPLQVEFHLPASLKVRETLEVDVKIGNNINSCMDVTALLALSEGAQFLSNGLLYVTERLRLGPHGATSLVVRILVTTAGLKNMTVEVNGYTSSNCEGGGKRVANTTLAGAVIRSATVRVHPEGLVKTDTDSAYFCANENILVSTADKFKYEWIAAPRNKNGIIVEVKAGSFSKNGVVHIALAENRVSKDKMYQIVIGDDDNSITWIGKGKHDYGIKLAIAQTPAILSKDQWCTFWITWDKKTIIFGNGSIPNQNPLLKWRMDNKIKIQQIGLASTWGSVTEFRVWNVNEEAGFSQVLHLDTPKSVVPGSEFGELLVVSGLALNELTISRNGGGGVGAGGLGEALAAITPLLTLHQFEQTDNASLREKFITQLPSHIQTILSYRKVDNSFSEHQMLGSHRNTIAVLEALTKTQSYFNVDPELIENIKRWVQLRQEDDGSFTPLPGDRKLPTRSSLEQTPQQQNLEHITEITAETVIALYEIGIESDVDSDTLEKAKVFLENNLPKIETSEAIAAVTLALVLVKSATVAWAIEKLRNCSTTDDNEFGWAHFLPKKDAADWLYETENGRSIKEPVTTTIDEYRASIYALSTFCAIGDLKFAESATRYLFFHSHMLDKHPELVYSAVKAFAQYNSLLSNRHRSLTISLATSGMELTDTLELKGGQKPHVLHLPSLPTKVFVYATGAGCATIQGRTTYSTYSTKSNTTLLEISSDVVEEIQPDHSSVEEIEGKSPIVKIKTCFKWKGSNSSGILRMEVTLFSGFELNSIPPLLLNPQVNMTEMLHGYYDNNLWFVFANVTPYCPVCVQYSVRSGFVISAIRPAYARVYPVSRQDLAADTFFHTSVGSSLLKDITEDDLFTWFRNSNNGNASLLKAEDSKQCALLSTSTTEVTSFTNTPKIDKNDEIVTKKVMVVAENTSIKPAVTTTKSNLINKLKLIVKKQIPKHVNTKKQEVPKKFLQNDDKDKEITATFAPEIKNDRYVLLDKEQLWGMLKEVVTDEINKKIKPN